MNKLLEIFQNRKLIWDGLKNNLIKSEHIEALYLDRNAICNKCPYMIEKGDKQCSIPGTDPCCPECGCSLAVKLRSPNAECPKGFWKAVMTDQEAQLLNTNLNESNKNDRGEINT